MKNSGNLWGGHRPAADGKAHDLVPRLNVITIDGVRGVGKSMLAGSLRDRFGCGVLDIGPVFRVIAWLFNQRPTAGEHGALEALRHELQQGNLKIRMDVGCGMAASRIELCGESIEQPLWDPSLNQILRRTAGSPAVIAVVKGVARELVSGERCVVVGREVGTHFFPEAALKFLLEAHPGVRRKRKAQQLSMVIPGLEDARLTHSEPSRDWNLAQDVIRIETTLLTPDDLLAKVCRSANVCLGWAEIEASVYE